MHQEVSAGLPRKRPLLATIIAAIVISGVFAILCNVTTYNQFLVVLAAFLGINIISWQVYNKYAAEPLDSVASQDPVSAAKVHFVHRHNNGKWQWMRFIVGGLGIGALCLLLLIKNGFHLSSALNVSPELLRSFGILAWVLLMEIWMWYARIRLKSSLSAIDILDRKGMIAQSGGTD